MAGRGARRLARRVAHLSRGRRGTWVPRRGPGGTTALGMCAAYLGSGGRRGARAHGVSRDMGSPAAGNPSGSRLCGTYVSRKSTPFRKKKHGHESHNGPVRSRTSKPGVTQRGRLMPISRICFSGGTKLQSNEYCLLKPTQPRRTAPRTAPPRSETALRPPPRDGHATATRLTRPISTLAVSLLPILCLCISALASLGRRV